MVGPFVAIGTLYLMAVALVPFAIAAVLGDFIAKLAPIAAIPLAVGVTLLGLLALAMSYDDAAKQEDRRWMADHFLAPGIAITFVLLFSGQVLP